MKPTLDILSYCKLLSLVFITLRLCAVIDWHWAWVLSPLWCPLALSMIYTIVNAIAGGKEDE